MRVHNSLVPHLKEYFGPQSLVMDHQPTQSAKSSMKATSQTREAGYAPLGNLDYDIPPANYSEEPSYHPTMHEGESFGPSVDIGAGAPSSYRRPRPMPMDRPSVEARGGEVPVMGSTGMGTWNVAAGGYLAPGVPTEFATAYPTTFTNMGGGQWAARAQPVTSDNPYADAQRGADPSGFGDLRSLSIQPSWMSGGGGGPMGMGFGFLRAQ